MKEPTRETFTPTAIAACAGFWMCWTIGPIYIKLLAGPLDVWTQNMARYGVACVFWLPFLVLYGRRTITRSILLKALIPTGFNLVMQCCWAGAFYYEQPAFMVLLSRTSVLWVGLFSLVFFADERRLFKSPFFWTGAVMALTGLAGVIINNPRFELTTTWTGIALAMGASLAWAAYPVSVKIVFKHVDSRVSFSVITIYTVIGLSVLAALFGRPSGLLELSLNQVGYVVISGITAIALAHVFFYAAIHRIGATIPSMINLLTPFTVLLLSGVVFDELLTGLQWVFGITLIVGIALSIRAQKTVKLSE